MHSTRNRLLVRATVASLLGLGLAISSIGITHAKSGSSYVRVAQSAPAVQSVDVYLDGATTPLVSNFTFGTITNYVPWSVGQHTVQVVPTGKAVSAATVTQTITTANGTNYTLAYVGDDKVKQGLYLFDDDNTIATGMGKLRFYHVSTDAGPAGLTMSFTPDGGKTNLPNIGFEQVSKYFSLKPGAYTFYVTLTGGTTTVPQQITLQANHVTSIFGVGQVNNKGTGSFRFVIATAAATPTGLPPTGYGPRVSTAASDAGTPIAALVGIVAVLALIGLGVLSQRRAFRVRAQERVAEAARQPVRVTR